MEKLNDVGVVFLKDESVRQVREALRSVPTMLPDDDPLKRWSISKDLGKALKKAIRQIEGVELRRHHQLALVQRDLRTNQTDLAGIRRELYAMGITLDDWLIEFREHLFDSRGCEAVEPILDISYLGRVAGHMWNLSRRVFGASIFDYDTLAAEVRDSKVERVKRAVHRLKVLTCDIEPETCDGKPGDAEDRGAVECDDATWKWRVKSNRDTCTPCSWVSLDAVRSHLDQLQRLIEPIRGRRGQNGR